MTGSYYLDKTCDRIIITPYYDEDLPTIPIDEVFEYLETKHVGIDLLDLSHFNFIDRDFLIRIPHHFTRLIITLDSCDIETLLDMDHIEILYCECCLDIDIAPIMNTKIPNIVFECHYSSDKLPNIISAFLQNNNGLQLLSFYVRCETTKDISLLSTNPLLTNIDDSIICNIVKNCVTLRRAN